MLIYINKVLVEITKQEFQDLIDSGLIQGSLDEYIQSGDIPVLEVKDE